MGCDFVKKLSAKLIQIVPGLRMRRLDLQRCNMTLSQIQNFVLVARELSYSSVAEKTFISRQAIARSIHELEKELNLELFQTDHTNRLCLTAVGAELLPEFEQVLEQTSRIQARAQAFSQKQEPLQVAFSDSIAVFIFQDIIGMIYNTMAQNPSLISQITQESNLKLFHGENTEADIILMLGKEFQLEGYTTEILKSYDAVLSIPYTSSLYQERELCVEDLRGQTLICPIPPNEELEAFARCYDLELLTMSNFYACTYASIQNQYLILDVPVPSYDQTIIQKKISGFSFSWDLLLLYKSDSVNPNITLVKNQIQKLARAEKASWIFQGPL